MVSCEASGARYNLRGRRHRRGCASHGAGRHRRAIDRLAPHGETNSQCGGGGRSAVRPQADKLNALVETAAALPTVDREARTGRPGRVYAAHRFAFHHPLIRAVAYRSQLTSARADLHRRLAAALEAHDPESVDESAALIAEHLEAADDLVAAFSWHMRAGEWLNFRDNNAARLSWQRARQVADRMPVDQPGRDAMRIGPRALLCATAFRTGSAFDEKAFDETCRLADAVGDKVSLAMAMSGRVLSLSFGGRYSEPSRLAAELLGLVESIGDQMLELTLLPLATAAILGNGELTTASRLARRIIDLADGDPLKGGSVIESPLTLALMLRATERLCRGAQGWKAELSPRGHNGGGVRPDRPT